MKTFKQFKKQLLENKEVKVAYDALGPEFVLIKSLISKRLEKGMTQKELAHRIGTKQSAISRFEAGSYNPSFNFLRKIAEAMSLNMKVLFTEK